MAINNKPDMSVIWAEEGARVQPTESKIKEGWVVEPPPHQWENWSQWRQESAIAHIFQRGVAEWDNKTHYHAGNLASYVLGSDGKIYKSITHSGGDGGAPKDPTDVLNSSFWKVAFTSSDEVIPQVRVGGLVDALADKASSTEFQEGLDTKLNKNSNLNDIGNVALGRQNLGLKGGATANVVQNEGQSTTDVMSQKAVSDFLVERTGQATSLQYGITRYATQAEAVNPNKENVAIDPKSLFRIVNQYLSVEVKKPINLTPTDGQLSVERTPTLVGSVYMPLYSPNTRATRRFQVTLVSDHDFVSPIYDESENSDSHTMLEQLPITTEVMWRIRDESVGGDLSLWSTPTAFSTSSEAIQKPSVLSPIDGAINIKEQPILESSVFTVVGGSDVFTGLVFEIKDLGGSVIHTSPKITQYTYEVPSGILFTGENTYSVRVRHYGTTLSVSPWSEPNSFTTDNVFINTPSIISPTFGETDVPEQPILESSVFTVSGGVDTFQGAVFEVKNNLGVIVHTSPKVVSTTYSIPAGILEEDSQYSVRVRHYGVDRGESSWSSSVTFYTEAQFIPTQAGAPFGGGYFVAMYNHPTRGVCALVDGGKACESGAVLSWKTSYTNTAGTDDLTNGDANTLAMTSSPSLKTAHPAATFVSELAVGGYEDWVLPAKNQLELCYRYLKPFTQTSDTSSGSNYAAIPQTGNYYAGNPTQTGVTNYKRGGADAYLEEAYCTSSQFSTVSPWLQSFHNGRQINDNGKGDARLVRGVRSVEV